MVPEWDDPRWGMSTLGELNMVGGVGTGHLADVACTAPPQCALPQRDIAQRVGLNGTFRHKHGRPSCGVRFSPKLRVRELLSTRQGSSQFQHFFGPSEMSNQLACSIFACSSCGQRLYPSVGDWANSAIADASATDARANRTRPKFARDSKLWEHCVIWLKGLPCENLSCSDAKFFVHGNRMTRVQSFVCGRHVCVRSLMHSEDRNRK